MKTLVYVGAHLGGGLSALVSNYDIIYAFEANSEFCMSLRYNFARFKGLEVVHGAVCNTHGGQVAFNISKNNGDSSSLLLPNKDNALFDLIKPTSVVMVPSINLGVFMQERGITYIDSYVSDLQGYDFEVLKTIKPLIDSKAIGSIQCEVEKTDKPPIYIHDGIQRNTEENFNTILNENYQRVATGWGSLADGVFQQVPPEWGEWDIRWKLKNA